MAVPLTTLAVLNYANSSPSATTPDVQSDASSVSAEANLAAATKSAKAHTATKHTATKHTAAKHTSAKAKRRAAAKRAAHLRSLAEKPLALTADGHLVRPGTKAAAEPTRSIARATGKPVHRSARSTIKQRRTAPKALRKTSSYKLAQHSASDPGPTLASQLSSMVASQVLGAGSISGTVTDKATGLPVVGACVTAYPQSESGLVVTDCVDGSGHYDIGLAEGSYYLQADDNVSGHISGYSDGSVDVADGQAVTGADFALVQGGAVAGTVTNSHGDPLAGVCVDVFNSDSDEEATGCTDASGHYTSRGLPAGTWTVRFDDREGQHLRQYYDGASTSQSATPVTIAVGQITGNIDATLVLGGSVSGTVTDADSGDPLADVCVDVFDDDDEAFTCTDDAGHYTSPGLPTGSYTVNFDDNSGSGHRGEFYDGTTNQDDATPVAVTLGQNTPGINASLVLLGRIAGTVTSAPGVPIDDTCVEARDANGDFVNDTRTAADGTYTLTGLEDGDYTLKFGCGDDAWVAEWYDDVASQDAATPVSTSVGTTTSGIDARLARAVSISGTI
ncbi:MAG: carboxypeptidase regulatory-like domain-containing protein, partial [Marmoricola sp.]